MRVNHWRGKCDRKKEAISRVMSPGGHERWGSNGHTEALRHPFGHFRNTPKIENHCSRPSLEPSKILVTCDVCYPLTESEILCVEGCPSPTVTKSECRRIQPQRCPGSRAVGTAALSLGALLRELNKLHCLFKPKVLPLRRASSALPGRRAGSVSSRYFFFF